MWETNEKSLSISDEEFHRLRDIIFKNFGINLTDAKKGLVISRLQSVLKKFNFKSFSEYYQYVQNDSKGQALNELVNKISTNFTYFYREEKHFEFLIQKVLPAAMAEIKAQGQQDLRLWCAGCSSGEEPYTIIMLMMEAFKDYHLWNAGVLATDISENALNFAQKATYAEERIERLPPGIIPRYFNKQLSGEYKVIDKVTKEVTFRRLNLMNTTFPFKKPFHTIFCRNVMIYFDPPTKDALVARFAQNLVKGGYLFIGHSESVSRSNDQLEYIMPAVYRKK